MHLLVLLITEQDVQQQAETQYHEEDLEMAFFTSTTVNLELRYNRKLCGEMPGGSCGVGEFSELVGGGVGRSAVRGKSVIGVETWSSAKT